MIAVLNVLEVKSTDILNAYVQPPVTKKVLTLSGPEFGIDADKALYTRFMESMVYVHCWANPNLWMRRGTYPDVNIQYCLYPLWYVDNILCIHYNAKSVLQCQSQSLLFKLGCGYKTCILM